MDLRERLESALGETYVLQRELTGGGMARVFLAEERGLERQIVIKVLSPEAAEGVSSDRFTREIRTSAQLQHPNIVPLLTAGVVERIPFYTMPYIDGESLRGRMQSGPLSIATIVSILRDVTRALSYAHAHGIVHRDIKPANILMTGDAAVVTDFGIAKAIVSARDETTAANLDALTQTGSAIGTLAYMAPEQAAGEPNVDQRADIYSLGVLAYELLTGTTPFAGSSPQKLLQAKMSSTPRSVIESRSGIPVSLSALVMRCLSIEKADRPQTASEVAAALENVTSDLDVTRAIGTRRRRRAMYAASMLIVASALIAARALHLGPFESQLSRTVGQRPRVLVADFDGGGDASLGMTVTELVRVAMSRSRSIATVDRSAVNYALQRMQRSSNSTVNGITAREVAVREGIAVVVEGKVVADGSSYILSAHIVAPQTGNALASASEIARKGDDLIPAVDRLTSALRSDLGESMRSIRSTPPLEQVTTSSLEALRKYSAAVAADWIQDEATSTALLREAIAADSNFAMAYRKLGNNLYWTRNRAEGVEYLRKGYALRDRLTDTERNLLVGTYNAKVTEDFPRAKAAFESVLAIDPDNRIALDNAAYIANRTGDYRRAEEVYGYIAKRWPTSLALTSLAVSQDYLGKIQQADSNHRGAIALSRPGENLAALNMALYHFIAIRKFDSAAVYAKVAAEWPGIDRRKRVSAMLVLGNVALAEGRVRDTKAILRDAASIERQLGNIGGALAFDLSEARVTWWMLGDRVTALQQIDSVRVETLRLPAPQWPIIPLVEAYARLGKTEAARSIAAAHSRLVDSSSAIDLAKDSRRAALLAHASGKTEEAIEILRRRNADADCAGCFNAEIGFLFDEAGEADSALAVFERHLRTFIPESPPSDSWFLARLYRRLGELHEAKGHPREATVYYGKFIELWKRADPELQPQVQEARRRVARLSALH